METIRPFLELLYFITGGPVLAVFAFLALKQITVAKQNSRTQSMRDAYRLAAEQVLFYAEKIVPGLNELDRLIEEEQLNFLNTSEVEVTSSHVSVKSTPTDQDIEKMIEIAPVLVPILNRLETFSVFFTSKVAAESVAFSSIGASFTRNITKLLPMFIGSTKNKSYENIMRLFILWHQRLEAEQLEQQSNSLRERMRGLRKGRIIPIGGSDD